jgi:hypothetical protein
MDADDSIGARQQKTGNLFSSAFQYLQIQTIPADRAFAFFGIL